MGSRGPIPLSVEVLEARGSTLVKQRRAKMQVSKGVNAVAPIACPSWLGVEAKAVWRRVVASLKPFGILRSADATALGRYCELWTLWRMLVTARDAESDPNDPKHIRLERRILKVSVLLLTLEDRFAMSPASRARLGLGSQVAAPTNDPKLRFFAGLIPPRGEVN